MKNKAKNKLIILEDVPDHAEAIRLALPAVDYDCYFAITLKEFNQIITCIVPDLVISDINLPDGTAFDLLPGSLESQPWPVLVMTSFGDEELAVKVIKSGAQDFIVKSPEVFKNIDHVVKRNLRDWTNLQKSRENESSSVFPALVSRESPPEAIGIMPGLIVLIAEDDEISYVLLRESLKLKSIKTYRAKNGQEAVEMIKNQSDINLVLMDIKMPVMGGIEATKLIKEISPGTPVIIQSAYANQSEIQQTFQAGCDDYMTKPVNISALFNKISTYCKI